MTTTDFTDILAVAIRESIQTNRRVDIVVQTDDDLDAVFREADDCADENDGTIDAWGHDDDGNEWRLCVTVAD